MTDDALAQELIDMTERDRRLQGGALGDDFAAQLAHRRVTVCNGIGWPRFWTATDGRR
jgi:hypothetical protein